MPTFYSYYSHAKNPVCKHEIEGKGIATYEKKNVAFSFLESWKKVDFFEITSDTVIVEEHLESDGRGYITLKNERGKFDFYVYGIAAEFIKKLKMRFF